MHATDRHEVNERSVPLKVINSNSHANDACGLCPIRDGFLSLCWLTYDCFFCRGKLYRVTNGPRTLDLWTHHPSLASLATLLAPDCAARLIPLSLYRQNVNTPRTRRWMASYTLALQHIRRLSSALARSTTLHTCEIPFP